MRRRARVDRNHGEIREALRACGWMVYDSSGVGNGFPDLVAAKAGRTIFVEVKDGTKRPSERKLTPAEAQVHASFAASGVPVLVIESVAQVAAL